MSGFNNMIEVKIAHSNVGKHWFSESTVRAWNSKIETPLLDGRYWIESTDSYDRSSRRVMIARIDESTCDIAYLGIDYRTLRFDSVEDAKIILRAMEIGV